MEHSKASECGAQMHAAGFASVRCSREKGHKGDHWGPRAPSVTQESASNLAVHGPRPCRSCGSNSRYIHDKKRRLCGWCAERPIYKQDEEQWAVLRSWYLALPLSITGVGIAS